MDSEDHVEQNLFRTRGCAYAGGFGHPMPSREETVKETTCHPCRGANLFAWQVAERISAEVLELFASSR